MQLQFRGFLLFAVDTIDFSHAVIECLRSNPQNRVITANHIKINKNIRSFEDLQEKLESLVGIKKAKAVITELLLSNRFNKELGKPLPSSNNMIFVGNPGTGKQRLQGFSLKCYSA